MNYVYQFDQNDPYYWVIFGVGNIDYPWGFFMPGGAQTSSHWLRVRQNPDPAPGEMASIYLGDEPVNYADPRDADRVTFEISGRHSVFLNDVEYVDATVGEVLHLNLFNHYGFTTDGSVKTIAANVGNHEVLFTTAINDSAIFLGSGWDQVRLADQLDIPGTQYWSLIRRPDNQLDAYSLLTGRKVTLEAGNEARNAENAGNRNYGEIEELFAYDAEDLKQNPAAGPKVFIPGGDDGPTGLSGLAAKKMGLQSNIDLRSDGQTFSDSFNLAYFNFIRYTSDNVWVGEATIHDGTVYSTPSDRTVTQAKYGFNAPVLDGQLSVIGQSRNGTHDLIVSEQATAIDGKLRVYTFNVQSDLYNEFNEVFLGSAAYETVSLNGSGGTAPADRVALYGFGGNDVLLAGLGKDYLFGGQSVYNQLLGTATDPSDNNLVKYLKDGQFLGTVIGNQVTGEEGADYFGVGNTNSSGSVHGSNRIVVSVASGVAWQYSVNGGVNWTNGTVANWATGVEASFERPIGAFEVREGNNGAAGKALSWYHQGYATDVIMDWDVSAGNKDTLVVLSNGVAVVNGLRAGNSTSDLSVANTIDLRAVNALATSDQNGTGARGGDGWDSTQSLQYIFDGQGTRDAKSITNEFGGANPDITVRNDGLIVIRGLGGSDTIYGSAGDDYIYGNNANNDIHIGNGGNDRVYYDTFDGAASKHFVTGFTASAVNGAEADLFFLNKRVIDAFNSIVTYTGRDIKITSANNVNAEYVQARAYNPGVNFLHDSFYNPSIATSNLVHTQEDGRGLFSNSFTEVPTVSGSDGTSSYIGLGMVTAGRLLLGVPFVGPIIGGALIASGTLLGGAGGIVTTTAHQNATYAGNVGNYLNVLTDVGTNTGNGQLLKPAHSTTLLDTSVRFLDFFQNVNANDGYIPLVEFTAHSNQALYGYFALHSKTHTFVYLVASRDNLVENSEALLVAQIEGILRAEDFAIYDGNFDIYNFKAGGEPAVVLREPSISAVSDSKTAPQSPDFGHDNGRIDNAKNPIVINVTVNDAVSANSFFRIYDGATKIYDGRTPVDGQDVVEVAGGDGNPNTFDFKFTDSRPLGTTVKNVTNNAPADTTQPGVVDDTYVLTDGRVRYTVELVDGVTGIPTRDTSIAITISGGNGVIDGGAGQDILLLTETSSFLNGFAADADGNNRLKGIETISLAPNPLAASSVTIDGARRITAISFSGNPGSGLQDGTYSLTISDEVVAPAVPGSDATASVVVSGGVITSATVTNGGSGYSSSTQALFTPGVQLVLTGQLEGFEVVGSAGFDTIVGGSGNDSLNGLGGNDVLTGGIGNDVFVYASISDLFSGSVISDSVTGGDGTDSIRIDQATGFTISASDSFARANTVETLAVGDANSGAISITLNSDAFTTAGIRNVNLSADTNATGVNTINTSSQTNTSIELVLTGSNGADNIIGGSGNDTIIGGAGTDTLIGAAGSDSIDGSAGADIIWSGRGSDHVRVGNAGKVAIVGDLSSYTAPSDPKLQLINSTLQGMLGYNPNLTSAYTTDVGAGETVTFVGTGTDRFELHLFGTVDLSQTVLQDSSGSALPASTYDIYTYSSLSLTEAQLNAARSINLVDNASGTSSHTLVITNSAGVALSNDDQLAVINTWLERPNQQLFFGSGGAPAGLSVAGTTLSFNAAPSTPAFTGEKIQGASTAALPAGNPIGANPNTVTLLYDSRNDTDGIFDDPSTSGGRHFAIGANDRFKGAMFVSTFEPGVTAVPVPPTFLGTGDDQVHNRQFEVYYGDYDVQRDIFTVLSTPYNPATSAYTLILYDNDTSTSVGFIDALVFANFMGESSWRITDGGTPTATLSYIGALPTSTGAVNQVTGTSASEALFASGSGSNYLYALGGNDTITGTAQRDFIFAGTGGDLIRADRGPDIIDLGDNSFNVDNGDASVDTIVVSTAFGGASDSAIVAGTSEVVQFGATPGENRTGQDYVYKFERGLDVVRIVASAVQDFDHATDTFEVRQQVNPGTVAELEQYSLFVDLDGAGMGADDIAVTFRDFGGTGFIRDSISYDLTGSSGNDRIVTGSLSDTISGGGGSDHIDAGGGADTIIWTGSAGVTIYGGAGNDNIDPDAAETGNDLIYGDAGNDTIYGGSGNDTIYGGADGDTIYGEAGDDHIYAGAGNDVLSGGLDMGGGPSPSGTDTFWVSAATVNTLAGIAAANGVDTIRDFSTDKIDMTLIGVLIKGDSTIVSSQLDGHGDNLQADVNVLRISSQNTGTFNDATALANETFTLTFGSGGTDNNGALPNTDTVSDGNIVVVYESASSTDARIAIATVVGGDITEAVDLFVLQGVSSSALTFNEFIIA